MIARLMVLAASLILAGDSARAVVTQRPVGRVSGIVVSDETPPRPLRRATVSLLSPDFGVPLSTVTGDDGRFVFDAVPAGYYGVVASKPSYVGAFHGSKRPGRGPGVPIAVEAGARVDNVSLTLTRGAVISGTLRLPGGEPAHNMPVTVVAVDRAGGAATLRYAGGRTATDDRGDYRVFGLPPGTYAVLARPSGLLMGTPTGPNDARQTTAAEVSWAQEMARRRAGVPSAAPVNMVPPEKGETRNYAPVFYPGTPDFGLAMVVDVAAGEERGGVDFALTLVTTAAVSGSVVDPGGQPAPKASVTIAATEDPANVSSVVAPRAAVATGADGTFVIPAVAPGRYRLMARGPAGSSVADSLYATADIVVDGRAVTNLAMRLEAGLTVSGRLVFRAATTPQPSAEDLARARVTLSPVAEGGTADAVSSARSSVSANATADGTFAVAGLVPGSYRISVTMPGVRTGPTSATGAWSLESVEAGSADVSDRAIELLPGLAVPAVVATFTDRPTVLDGTVIDQASRPAHGYPIVVFPTDRSEWRPGSRRVAVARPATDGRFRFVGLPPGSYYMAAVVSIDAGDLDDREFLEELATAAVTVELKAGETVTQGLRLMR